MISDEFMMYAIPSFFILMLVVVGIGLEFDNLIIVAFVGGSTLLTMGLLLYLKLSRIEAKEMEKNSAHYNDMLLKEGVIRKEDWGKY